MAATYKEKGSRTIAQQVESLLFFFFLNEKALEISYSNVNIPSTQLTYLSPVVNIENFYIMYFHN